MFVSYHTQSTKYGKTMPPIDNNYTFIIQCSCTNFFYLFVDSSLVGFKVCLADHVGCHVSIEGLQLIVELLGQLLSFRQLLLLHSCFLLKHLHV